MCCLWSTTSPWCCPTMYWNKHFLTMTVLPLTELSALKMTLRILLLLPQHQWLHLHCIYLQYIIQTCAGIITTAIAPPTHHLTSPIKHDLVLRLCSTCSARFSQGLTPSYRIAGRYGCLILLSTKTLGTVMRPTSFSLSLPLLLPLLSSIHSPPSLTGLNPSRFR